MLVKIFGTARNYLLIPIRLLSSKKILDITNFSQRPVNISVLSTILHLLLLKKACTKKIIQALFLLLVMKLKYLKYCDYNMNLT